MFRFVGSYYQIGLFSSKIKLLMKSELQTLEGTIMKSENVFFIHYDDYPISERR